MKAIEATLLLRNNYLKTKRVAAGLSQQQMSLSVGIPQMMYGELERFRYIGVLDKHLIAVCEYFGEEMDVVFPPETRKIVESRIVKQIGVSEIEYERRRALEYVPELEKTEEKIDAPRVNKEIFAMIETLGNAREIEVIKLRHGFYGEPETLEAIAKRLRITHERVRQIEAKAIRKMRHPTRSYPFRKMVEMAQA